MPQLRPQKLLNVVCEPWGYTECKIAYWLWRTVPFILIFIGTCGNIINLMILSKKRMRRCSINVYLLFLAGSDITVLWMGVLTETLYSITGINVINLFEISCRITNWVFYSAGGNSIWILALLTVERIIVIRAPLLSKKWISARAAANACIVCLSVVAIVNTHRIFGYRLYDVETFNETFGVNNKTKNIVKDFPCYYASKGYMNFFIGPWSRISLSIYGALPMLIITIGNIYIIETLLFSRSRRLLHLSATRPGMKVSVKVSSVCNNSKSDRVKTNGYLECKIITQNICTGKVYNGIQTKNLFVQKKKSPTKLLFILCGVFVLTTPPYFIYYVIRGTLDDVSYKEVAILQLSQAIVHNLIYCNYSFNFFFYFAYGSVFKQEWNKLIKRFRIFLKGRQVTSDLQH